jgi:hypothetical protein
MCQVRCRCRRMLSSPASDLAGELGRSRCPKPAPRPWPAQLKLSRARQAEFVICDCAIERSFAWATRCRRLVKDYERYATTLASFHVIAFVRYMLKHAAELMQSA